MFSIFDHSGGQVRECSCMAAMASAEPSLGSEGEGWFPGGTAAGWLSKASQRNGGDQVLGCCPGLGSYTEQAWFILKLQATAASQNFRCTPPFQWLKNKQISTKRDTIFATFFCNKASVPTREKLLCIGCKSEGLLYYWVISSLASIGGQTMEYATIITIAFRLWVQESCDNIRANWGMTFS